MIIKVVEISVVLLVLLVVLIKTSSYFDYIAKAWFSDCNVFKCCEAAGKMIFVSLRDYELAKQNPECLTPPNQSGRQLVKVREVYVVDTSIAKILSECDGLYKTFGSDDVFVPFISERYMSLELQKESFTAFSRQEFYDRKMSEASKDYLRLRFAYWGMKKGFFKKILSFATIGAICAATLTLVFGLVLLIS
jgi:hypothetical protein